MKILVLGSGNLGATISSIANSQGHQVYATYNRRQPILPGVSLITWDVLEDDLVIKTKDLNPDVVIHAIAMISPDTCEKEPKTAYATNSESVRLATEVARDKIFVYISSDYVFDGHTGGYHEDDIPNAINVYGKTKLVGETFAMQCPSYLIVRTAMYGCGVRGFPSTRIEEQLREINNGKRVIVAADQMGTPLWTGTVAHLILRLLAESARGLIHVAGPEAISKEIMTKRLAKAACLDPSLVSGSCTSALQVMAPRPHNVSLDCTELVKSLPYYPVSLDEDISRYIRAISPV